ncbi:right-handed parallel beta-helix repeat-containing protein [bacterium]|nr:right-handed parallel beta-helix repeat-containing protein [bacterium]
MKKLWIIGLLVVSSVQAQTTISVADFGAVPDSRANAVPAVKAAIEACRTVENPVLTFPKGRYDFWPQHCVEKEYFESNTTDNNPKRCAIFIEGFKALVMDGQGSSFVFHDRIQPFTVDRSENVEIRNCSIDWDIPLTAEGVVDNVDEAYIDLAINDRQFPYIIENEKLVFVGEGWKSAWRSAMEFDGNSLQVARDTGDRGCLGGGWRADYRAESLSPGHVRLHFDFKRKPAMGNVLVLRHSARDHAGLFFFHSKNVTVENVNLYHCAGLGVLAQFTENVTLRNYNTVPNPTRQVVSGHDDGAQISNCCGHILIEDCTFHGLMDDPINVHGTSVCIIGKPAGNRLTCQFMHGQATGMIWGRKGDRIGFIENASMVTVGEGFLTAFQAVNRDTFNLTFEKTVPEELEVGDALENLTWSPDLTVRGCHFMSNRARGLLVSTPGKVVIENNRFESSGAAILIAGDANYWYESGAVRDVTIRNNVFTAACMTSMYQFCEGVISIYPIIPELNPNLPFHRNIRIEKNIFHLFDFPMLYAKSVDGLSFSENRMVRSHDFEPFHTRKATVTLEACKDVRIEKNRFEGDVLGRNVVLEKMDRRELRLDMAQGLRVE